METNWNKDLVQVCKQLGPQYSLRIIDDEQVIYRDLGRGYDFEISNVHKVNTRKVVGIECTLYIWELSPLLQIVSTQNFYGKNGFDLAKHLEFEAQSYTEMAEEENKPLNRYTPYYESDTRRYMYW